MGRQEKPLGNSTWRLMMRTLNRSAFDRVNTYTYSDSQVVSIFRFGILTGIVCGAAIAAALVKLSAIL